MYASKWSITKDLNENMNPCDIISPLIKVSMNNMHYLIFLNIKFEEK